MSGQQQGGDDKHSMQILWVIFGIFALCGIIWYAFSEQLKWFFIYLRLAQFKIAYFIFYFLPFDGIKSHLEDAIALTKLLSPKTLTMSAASYLSREMGKYYMVPVIIGLMYFAYAMYGRNVKMRYKKRYDMKVLASQENDLWPQIKAVEGLDLVNEDLESGPWAMGQQPMHFARQHKLLNVSVQPPTPGKLSEGPQFEAVLDFAKSDAVFSNQLGRLWQGPEHMPPHRRALFACFIARGCKDSNAARELLAQMSRSCAGNSAIDTTGADALWQKHYKDRDIQEICQQHAYEFTLMISLFLFAREDGVFATADFLWLKPRDRRLWYVLNSVGRQTPFVEAGGVYAHWLAEKTIRRGLSVPMVREATKALDYAVGEIIYKPDPDEKDALLKEAEANNS